MFIPMTDLLGGQPRAGFGWNMLMDCLAEGRGISLPALSIAASRSVAVSVGAYARIRKQFKVPIADMEGMSSYCCLRLSLPLSHTPSPPSHTPFPPFHIPSHISLYSSKYLLNIINTINTTSFVFSAGVQEALARIGGNAYIMQSAQLLTNAMLNQHEQVNKQ